MKHREDVSLERLKEVLDYNPNTGRFSWRIKTAICVTVGNEAGCIGGPGYRVISIDKKTYQAHRLAWLYVYGEWPKEDIDHKNNKREDNRIANLRAASRLENRRNSSISSVNTSGFKGVSWEESRKKWRSQITLHGKAKHLGRFDDAESAHKAYCDAADALYGQFANHG